METVLLSDAEKRFIIHGIQDGFRTDGRACEDFRKMDLKIGLLSNANGSSKLRLGNSELLVGVKGELTKVNPQNPGEGQIKFHVDCSPNASPTLQGRKAKERGDVIASMLTRIYQNKSSLDLKSLCVIPGKLCWVVHVDVLILECGGNLLDATSFAVKAAIYNTGIPNLEVKPGDEGEEEVILSDDPLDVKYLNTSSVPILTTVCKVGHRHVVDASVEEDLCTTASLVLGVTNRGRVLGSRKQGTGSLDPETLLEMIEFGTRCAKQLHVTLDKMLKTQSNVDTLLHG